MCQGEDGGVRHVTGAVEIVATALGIISLRFVGCLFSIRIERKLLKTARDRYPVSWRRSVISSKLVFSLSRQGQV